MSGSDAAAAVEAGGAGGQARAFILGADLSGVQAAVDRIPEAWSGATTVADLAERLEAYTKDVVEALTGAGARPDVVQIGNEITAGMLTHVPDADTDCWGNGAATRGTGVTGSSANTNWANLAALLNAGIAGVKEVDARIEVMLYIENTDDLEGVRGWVSSARSHGVHPELSFAIAEYNPEPRRANEIMRDLENGRGLGTFFWEPTQGGDWGRALFTCAASECRANAADFAVFDQLRDDFGL